LGGKLLGWRTVCAVELDAYCRRVLLARQRDGFLPRFPIWDDVQTFDGRPWRGSVDVVSGGFPCQDISVGNQNGAGINGPRSGLWKEMRRIICEVRPCNVFVENSPNLINRGIGVVLRDLAQMGYDAQWGVLGSCDTGGNNKRLRIWIAAHLADTNNQRHTGAERKSCTSPQGQSYGYATKCSWWRSEPDVQRVASRMADRRNRLKAIGNGQVPAVVALAWRLLGGPV